MYTAKSFTIPTITGLSQKQIEVHLSLYEGYVKHANLILETIRSLRESDATKNAYLINELRRRFAFEFDGMRMHELYFEQFTGGPSTLSETSTLTALATKKYGGFAQLQDHIREVSATRGIGWVVVYYDISQDTLHTTFVSDHEIGQLSGLTIIFALDVWEHAFMVDYVPSEKKNYVDTVLSHTNWDTVNQRIIKTDSHSI